MTSHTHLDTTLVLGATGKTGRRILPRTSGRAATYEQISAADYTAMLVDDGWNANDAIHVVRTATAGAWDR